MERSRRGPRYHATGGLAAWRTPILAAGFAGTAAAMDDWSVSAVIVAIALIVDALERAVLLEVSTAGLIREVSIGGAAVGPARVIAWPAVTEVTTRWRRPRDFSRLETEVVGRGGERITFDSRMGAAAYRRLIVDVLRHAPQARRTGLTLELLAEIRAGGGARRRLSERSGAPDQ